jgi:hypothetical protein
LILDVASQNSGLYGRAKSDYFIGVQLRMRFGLEEIANSGANQRDPRGPTN